MADWIVRANRILSLPQFSICELVWDSHDGGRTERVRLVSNGVSAFSGFGSTREEALDDLMHRFGLKEINHA